MAGKLSAAERKALMAKMKAKKPGQMPSDAKPEPDKVSSKPPAFGPVPKARAPPKKAEAPEVSDDAETLVKKPDPSDTAETVVKKGAISQSERPPVKQYPEGDGAETTVARPSQAPKPGSLAPFQKGAAPASRSDAPNGSKPLPAPGAVPSDLRVALNSSKPPVRTSTPPPVRTSRPPTSSQPVASSPTPSAPVALSQPLTAPQKPSTPAKSSKKQVVVDTSAEGNKTELGGGLTAEYEGSMQDRKVVHVESDDSTKRTAILAPGNTKQLDFGAASVSLENDGGVIKATVEGQLAPAKAGKRVGTSVPGEMTLLVSHRSLKFEGHMSGGKEVFTIYVKGEQAGESFTVVPGEKKTIDLDGVAATLSNKGADGVWAQVEGQETASGAGGKTLSVLRKYWPDMTLGAGVAAATYIVGTATWISSYVSSGTQTLIAVGLGVLGAVGTAGSVVWRAKKEKDI